MTLSCKDIEIIKFKFVIIAHLLCKLHDIDKNIANDLCFKISIFAYIYMYTK